MLSIDLNCDMGEGMQHDAEIMPFISSVNIACGYHAGDEAIMLRTIRLALAHGVAIGAHPSYPDRPNFGRVDILGEPGAGIDDLPRIITDQLVVLQRVCHASGVSLHHVKFHGALYNRAAKDRAISAILCETIRQFDPSLLLYGLSGSVMHEEAGRWGLRYIGEVFADRTYQEDGSLTPRSEPDALIEDPAFAVRQVLTMIREGKVVTAAGMELFMEAGTVCIHGDGAYAVEIVQTIQCALTDKGIAIQPPAPGRLP